MSHASCPISRDLDTLFRFGAIGVLDDRLLLSRFLEGGDDAGAAFEQIVARHGPMVRGVCRRVGGDDHVADDAFQAAFLVLALRAGAIRHRESLGPWLHGVASRVARRARDAAARRREVEGARTAEPEAPDAATGLEAQELRRVLDEELGRLPAKYRDPLVLCYLQGRSQDEAARELGWTKGTVSGRLARARELLRHRLTRRGVAPAAAAGLATSLAAPTASPAAVPPALIMAAARCALAARLGAAKLAGAPAAVLEPARGAIQTMSAIRWAGISARLTLAVLISAGVWAMAARGSGRPTTPPTPPVATAPAPRSTLVADPPLDDPLPEGATMRFGSPRYRHPTTIESLAISPDANVAAATSGTRNHGAARVYDLATGRTRFDLERIMTDAQAVAISPDGRWLAVTTFAVTSNPAVYLYDLSDGRELARIAYPAANPGSESDVLLFTPDGKHVVIKAADGKGLLRISLAERMVVSTYPSGGTVFAAALSPNGRQLVAGGFDYETGERFARQWEVATGRELDPLPTRLGTVRSAVYSPDGATIALGVEARNTSVVLLDGTDGAERRAIDLPGASSVRSLAFSPDGRTLAASGGSSTRLLDVTTGAERLRIDRGAIGLHFAPDGVTLVGAAAGTIERWDAATGRSLIPAGGESPVAQIAATRDGAFLVSLGQDGDGHVWDARTGEHRRRLAMGWQRGFALSPDGRFLVWPETDRSIEFPDADLQGVTRNGTRLRLFDLAAGAPVDRFEGFEGDIHDLYFIDGGKTLVTVEHYRREAGVRLWDIATGRVVRSFPAAGEPGARVWSSRLSPDGKVLAVTYTGRPGPGLADMIERPVRLWDVATGEERDGPPPHWATVDVMAFGPDGTTIVAATPNGQSIQVRDATTGQVRREFRQPPDRVTALALGPAGRLFTGSLDGTVLSWASEAVDRPAVPKNE